MSLVIATQPPFTPVDFKPEMQPNSGGVPIDPDGKYYINGVTEVGPGNWGWPTVSDVNPFYCPTLYTATVMRDVLAAYQMPDIEIFWEGPLGLSPNNPVRESVKVAKLRFPNGQVCNPGAMSMSWASYGAVYAEEVVIPTVRRQYLLTADGQ